MPASMGLSPDCAPASNRANWKSLDKTNVNFRKSVALQPSEFREVVFEFGPEQLSPPS